MTHVITWTSMKPIAMAMAGSWRLSRKTARGFHGTAMALAWQHVTAMGYDEAARNAIGCLGVQ